MILFIFLFGSVSKVLGTVYVWPMDTITNNKIDGDIPGTVHGGGTTTTGYHGSAFRCDKAKDTYIDLGDAMRNDCWGDPGNCPNGFTYLFWLKTMDLHSTGAGYVINNGGNTISSWGISVHIQDGYLHAGAGSKTEKWWQTGNGHGVPISTNVWYHIFLVWDYTNGLRLYRDGGAWNAVYSNSSRTAMSTTSFNKFFICKPCNSDLSQFKGDFYIDELIFMDYTVDLNFAIAHMLSYQNYDTTEDCGPDTTPGPIPLRCVQAMWFAVGCLTSGGSFPMNEVLAAWHISRPNVWSVRYDFIKYRSRSDDGTAGYSSSCMGNAVRDVALFSSGASSDCSSRYSVTYACDYALKAGNEWASLGEGVGMWINITFDAVYVVDNVRLKQRHSKAEQNKGLTFLFSDGLKYSVTTFQRPDLSNSGWDTFHLPTQVTTAWMQVYVDSVYTKVNNGFKQIQVFESPGPCLAGPCKNGGTCRWNKIQKYICYCKERYSGQNCENFEGDLQKKYTYEKNSFLTGSIFYSETIRVDLECAQRCLNNVECLSYNVYTESNGKLTCDLNSNSPAYDIGLNLSFRAMSTFYYNSKLPEDCESVQQGPDGVYTIQPRNTQLVVKVKCEGGWTVIARRTSTDLLFNQTWHAYKYGFGSVSGDHWLGNEYIHALTNQASYSIRMEEKNINGTDFFANYDKFLVGSEEEKYTLHQWSGYYGNLASSYVQKNVGMYFTTLDRDNDRASYNCADEARMGGGWWYNSCTDVSITSHYPLDNGTCARSNSTFCMRDYGIQNGGIDKTLLVAATLKIRKA